MRICHMNLADNGSTGHICRNLMEAKDIDSLNFVGTKKSDQSNIIQAQSNIGKKIHRIIAGVFDRDNVCSIGATKKVLKEIDKFSPDIIHLHNLHGYYINYILLFDYIKKNEMKVVWTLHDCWPITGHCSYFDSVNCNKWTKECHNCENLNQYPRSLIFDRSKQLYKMKKEAFNGVKNMTLVCPSQWLMNLIKQSFLKDYPVRLINNGINTDTFTPIEEHSFDDIIDRNKRIILGVAAPFDDRKGYHDFIKLRKAIDNNKYQIVMVGVNKKQIVELSNYGIVGIERTENQKKLAELYSLAYAFFNPTYQDNYPTVNMEAISCGCPIITYRTGGSPEFINGNNGFVIDTGKIDGVVDVLESCDKFDRNVIADEAHIKHSKEVMAKEYLELYKEILKR